MTRTYAKSPRKAWRACRRQPSSRLARAPLRCYSFVHTPPGLRPGRFSILDLFQETAMEITTRPAITVSARDLERLETMHAGLPDDQPGVEALREDLARAQLAPSDAMPPDVVTMNS